ncbi:MAG: rhomboid family intramembrane serine protease [Verrucomicrobiota bacterium]
MTWSRDSSVARRFFPRLVERFPVRSEAQGVAAAALLFLLCASVFVVALGSPQALAWLVNEAGLARFELLQGEWYRCLTHLGVHQGWMHFGVNMLMLLPVAWAVGRRLGFWATLALFLAGGGVGGLLQVLLQPHTRLIGASGGIFGLVAAWAALAPESGLLPFGLPVRLRARYLGQAALLYSAGLSGWSLLASREAGWWSGVAHLAHLGGTLTGFLWVAVLVRVGGSGKLAWQRASSEK